MTENLFNSKIKTLQSDWGGEFQGLTSFLKENGIAHRVSCPYTPQQNGLAERKHRHIIETGLTLLAQSFLPHKFWDDAFVTAVHLINRMPSKTINNLCPYEKLYSEKPDYNSLRVFGCLCYLLTRPYNKHKLQFRSVKATFLGYSTSHKGYKALLPDGKVIVTRDIIFDEIIFPHQLVRYAQNKQPSFSSPAQFHHVLISHTPPPPPAPSPQDTHTPSSPFTPNTSSNQPSASSQHTSASASTSLSTSQSHFAPPSSHSADQPPQILPPAQTSQSTHHMTTRSKVGVFKPKIFSLTISPYLLPKSALEALLIPIWRAAMLAEFIALLKN